MKLLPKILALSLAMVVTTSVAANQLANEKQLSLLITRTTVIRCYRNLT